MKKITAILMGALLIGSAAYAQTNQVLSRNAVGYVKVTIATNTLQLLRNDFVGLSGPIAVSNTFASLPTGSSVILWDKVTQQWKPAVGKTFLGWGTGGTNVLNRGEAFFVKLPVSAPSNTYDIVFMGEVPDRFTAPTTTIDVVAGLDPVGFPYPSATTWTNTALSKVLPTGSAIITWNVDIQSYNPGIAKTFLGWGTSGNALVLQPGQGYFINAAVSLSPTNYSEVKPYTWP